MVTVQELRANYKLKPTMELLEIRRNAYEMLQRAGLAPEDLGLLFTALGVVNDELQLRGIGPLRDRPEFPTYQDAQGREQGEYGP